jgi:Putative auto-transporter adhesin, head GIN domain
MKKNFTLIILFIASIAWAQKTEKIKGSKIVTIENREIGNFESVEVSDNIEVFLEKGELSELKIEADENLHSIITVDLEDNILRLKTSKNAINYKKLILRITYTNDLKMVIAKNNSVINAIQEIQLEDITFKSYNESKLNLNVNAGTFLLQSDDKSKIELNLKAENTTIELSKNASLKALIATVDLKCDLYQKGKVNLEGDVINAKLRLDNNADFIGEKLVIKNCDLIAEGYSNATVNTDTSLNIDASGNSEVKIYGDQKIVIKQFVDSARLIKKPTK